MKIRDDIKRIHFVGIGGISMSALARWCKSEGLTVTGSDRVLSEISQKLCDEGITVTPGHDAGLPETDMVVYTSAVPEDCPEIEEAYCRGIPVVERHVFLGLLQKDFKEVIAVSGTHGKTTVTSLIAAIFRHAGKNFTAHIGGEAADVGGNFYSSGRDVLVTEACEYMRHFLEIEPTCLVILNIESDHPDYYKNMRELYCGFSDFSKKLRDDGFIIKNRKIKCEDLHICENEHILSFGIGDDSYITAAGIIERGGICEYDIYLNEEYFLRVRPRLYGWHNISNVLAATAVANLYGVNRSVIKDAVENFKGVKRRFEDAGEINGAKIIVDYAHHPSEIKATIAAARRITSGELRVYFQPHTFSRTEKYFYEFAEAFSEADDVSLLATYPARETPSMGRTAFELFYYIDNNVSEAKYFDNIVEAATNIIKTARAGDTVLILGAGDINEITKLLG